MNDITKCVALLGIILVVNLTAVAQHTETQPNQERIPVLSLETIDGNQVLLPDLQKKAFILFLLPKPESLSKGKELIEDVRTWTRKINNQTKQTFLLLIVEPLKTSFPFYGIYKRKLRKEPFPVVIDKNGDILNNFSIQKNKLNLLIADSNLKMIEYSTIEADPNQLNKKIDLIKKLQSENKWIDITISSAFARQHLRSHQ